MKWHRFKTQKAMWTKKSICAFRSNCVAATKSLWRSVKKKKKDISNTVVMVCTIKAQIQSWKALMDTIRGQNCLSKKIKNKKIIHNWGEWKCGRENKGKSHRKTNFEGGKNNVGHDDSTATPRIYSPLLLVFGTLSGTQAEEMLAGYKPPSPSFFSP